MEFNTRALFTESKESTVQGFAVIESSESGPGYGEPSYRVAEKWDRTSAESTWVTYWIPEETLLARIDRGECAHAKDLSDKQFRGVLNLAGVKREIDVPTKATA